MQQLKFVLSDNSNEYTSTSNASCKLASGLSKLSNLTGNHFHQNRTDCEIREFSALSGNCNDDNDIGNSILKVWTGSTTLGKIELNSFTNISIKSEDQNNNTLCQTFSKEMKDVLCDMCLLYLSLKLTQILMTFP